jgi:drug/metabolite transporter (DMT)-like permease
MVLINQKYGLKLLIKAESVYLKSVLLLFVAAVFWGASFTFVKWGLVDFTTTQLLFWRLFLAFIIGEFFLFLLSPEKFKNSQSDILLSLKPGLFLGGSLLFQIHGLHSTTATKSGFITSLYVILIPFISAFFFKSKIKYLNLFFAVLAFVGMFFLLDINVLSGGLNLNTGDLLTFGAAITAAFQIIYIGQTAQFSKNTFRYNNYQTFWCLCTVLPFLFFENWQKDLNFIPHQLHFKSVIAVCLLVVFVSIIAFFLQVHAQKKLSTTTASMLCLLEAPFSFLFAAFLIDEKLVGFQIFGAILILLSSALSVYIDRPQH